MKKEAQVKGLSRAIGSPRLQKQIRQNLDHGKRKLEPH